MQVHAVPESDRAIDASGRRLPWAYDRDTSNDLKTREPAEKGPFGRSQRRNRTGLTRSRSRTGEPRREEDRLRLEQLAAEDAVFGSLKKVSKDEGRREALAEVDANSIAQPTAPDKGEQEATEVTLYGFGEEMQWAAIDHYERVSGGCILEDYDRQPPGRRYDLSRGLPRSTSQKSLSRATLKKMNTFKGGEHWIKVTFDSRGAADLACASSPHIIKGYYVYAQPYQGGGPGKDAPIVASQAGAQITDSVLPPTFSTETLRPPGGSPNSSSTTATSGTITGQPQEGTQQRSTSRDSSSTLANSTSTQPKSPTTNPQTPVSQLTLRRSRIEGATPARVLPASAAMLPKQPTTSWMTGWLGTGDIIGSTVPKKEDGTFDYATAGLYWRLFWWLDQVLGTDFCGMKGD